MVADQGLNCAPGYAAPLVFQNTMLTVAPSSRASTRLWLAI